jgi:Protein of unknown function (DUF3120)
LFSYIVTLQNRKIWTPLWTTNISVWLVAVFLVSVPVFFEAPLVRYAPWLSLVVTVGWLSISRQLMENDKSLVWGSLIWGFSLTWLCGSIYWGWLRWEPLWHLPVEAIALPWAIWAMQLSQRNRYAVGAYFYLGSLLGTVVTDLYFAIAGLIPQWRSLMLVESDLSALQPILRSAVAQVQTEWGMAWAFALGMLLVAVGLWALRTSEVRYWAFSGAILSTILVDSVFGLVATLT